MSDLACFAIAFAAFVLAALHQHAHGRLMPPPTPTRTVRRPAQRHPIFSRPVA